MGIKKENRGILSKSLSNGKGVDRRIMTELDANKKAEELLKGAYDLHVHSSPSVFPRELDGFQLIREADAAGMAGVMLKSHYESTAVRAELINRYSGCKAKAYGGLCLNCPAGGLNVYAVKNALRAGAKIVWMPTRDAKNSLVFGNMEGDFFDRRGITILEQDGTLKECVYDIMDAIKEKDAFLATGHISPEESLILCREGRKRGVNMILTHPEFPRTRIGRDDQAELAKLGVVIEKNWFNLAQKSVMPEEMAETIRTVGSGHGYLATDRERGADTRFGIETVYRRDADLWDCGSTDTGHGPEGTGRSGMQINLYKCTFFRRRILHYEERQSIGRGISSSDSAQHDSVRRRTGRWYHTGSGGRNTGGSREHR